MGKLGTIPGNRLLGQAENEPRGVAGTEAGAGEVSGATEP